MPWAHPSLALVENQTHVILLPTCHPPRRCRSTTSFDDFDFAQSLLNLRRSSATFPSPSLHCTARRISLFSIFPLQDQPPRAWLSTCTKTHTQIMSQQNLLGVSIFCTKASWQMHRIMAQTVCWARHTLPFLLFFPARGETHGFLDGFLRLKLEGISSDELRW